MIFSNCDAPQDRTYNNADSFAFSFDEYWQRFNSIEKNSLKPKEEKIKIILKALEDHPFAKEAPTKAYEIVKFRVKLLNLE